ncbi:plexin-A4-like [Diadema setosum]|uniref:plexin-A4-like n=1 Tax=Diadema setosum TaxID=31175 RepID=UPI003B3ACFFF
MPNPVITGLDGTQSIMSGGLYVTVTGERFDLIQMPVIKAVSQATGAETLAICNGNGSATLLSCPSPPYPGDTALRRRRQSEEGLTASLQFDFDGFVINWSDIITYFPDPVYYKFDGPDLIFYLPENNLLELKGSNLDLASSKDDVQVFIGGDGKCDVQILESEKLICKMPDSAPTRGFRNGSLGGGVTRNLPAVHVVNGNLEFLPGFVKTNSELNILPIVISVMAVAILVMLFVFVVVGRRLTKKRREANQVREELELGRRRLRSRLREVPDTKLELTNVDERVKKYDIPFRDHNQYVTVMLFGGLGVRPETSDPEYMEDFMEQSLMSFYRSLKNEDTVVDVIKVLDVKSQNRQPTNRELIASLLSLAYLSEGKSIYFSKLISLLVRDRVKTTARSSGRLERLFGKPDSIVNKLVTNWIALCMYGYIKRHMLYPMFMLYQAMKTQCEKGPVDVTTGEAYFTLDYNRLFDQDIGFQEVTLFVVDEDDNAFLNVKVLDADSVGQAKQKILDSIWNAGECLLPRNGDALDVVWLKDAGTYLILRDEDEGTGGHVSGRVNTLKTYGLDHGCRVTLRPKGAMPDSSGYQQLIVHSIAEGKYESIKPAETETAPCPSTQIKSNHGAMHLKTKIAVISTSDPIRQRSAGLGKELAIPHMLTTKAAVGPYVTYMLESMFKLPSKLPLPVKHLFDIFDDLAIEYAVGMETYMAERWKRNCLTQFWVGLLASIPSLFDMPRSDPADQCLNVLVDAIFYATRDETPPETSKQQPYFVDYAPQSRMVTTFCNDVASLPKVRQSKLYSGCALVTKEFRGHFSHHAALLQLFNLTKHDLQDILQ